ncbi:TerB family tellurite resistance protein [Alphaproteobacteria bacterium]|nr:TerB family tellurite resistance protein [Alphaproteobacteria bacterium]
MINSLKNFFIRPEESIESEISNLNILCGIMIEAANIDGSIDQKELDKISNFLVYSFEEKQEDVQREIDKCINDLNNHKSLHFFTSKINKLYSDEKKIELIEILWEIILADGKVHDYESNLIRRLAGLLYLNDYECGKAKKKVLLKMEINE